MKTNETQYFAITAVLKQMRTVCGGGFQKPELSGFDISSLKDFIITPSLAEPDQCDAIGLLSRIDTSQEVVSLLENIALDLKRSIVVRTSAVLAMNHQQADAVEPVMMNLLQKGDLDFQHRVVAWLGTHGSKAAYQALNKAQNRMPVYLQERLHNFKSLVAFRHGLSEGDLDLSLVVYPKSKSKATQKAIKFLKRDSKKDKVDFSALGFDLESNLVIQPDGCIWQYGFFQRQNLGALLKAVNHGAKQVLGVLAYFEYRSHTLFTRQFVLANHNGKFIEVALMNPKGWITFTGSMEGNHVKLQSTNRHVGFYCEIQVDLKDLSSMQMYETPGTFKKLKPIPMEN